MLTRKLNKIFNNKAQSILELAIFGSIIIFLLSVLIQYGLNFNTSQHLSLQTFRKALEIAKTKTLAESPQVQESLTVIKDLPTPNPSDPFGIAETSPVMAQASALMSRDASAGYDTLSYSELPKVDIMINGVKKTYTTAGFGDAIAKGRRYHKKKTNYGIVQQLKTWDTPVGPAWFWQDIEGKKVRVGDSLALYDFNRSVSLQSGKTVTVVKTDREPDEGDKDIKEFWYLDNTRGDIDTTIQPEEGTPQGLQPGYIKEVTTEASIEKTETGSGISTTRKANIKEIIKRKVKTNRGDEEISTEVEQDKTSTWQTN